MDWVTFWVTLKHIYSSSGFCCVWLIWLSLTLHWLMSFLKLSSRSALRCSEAESAWSAKTDFSLFVCIRLSWVRLDLACASRHSIWSCLMVHSGSSKDSSYSMAASSSSSAIVVAVYWLSSATFADSPIFVIYTFIALGFDCPESHLSENSFFLCSLRIYFSSFCYFTAASYLPTLFEFKNICVKFLVAPFVLPVVVP